MRLLVWAGVFFGVCLLVGAAIIGPHVVQAVREFDGNRPLINGYNLWMLHAFPREIQYGNSSSIGDCTVPSTWPIGTHEVGRYAIVGNTIVGEIHWFSYSPTEEAPPGWTPPMVPPTHFILDTSAHTLVEFTSHQEWADALGALGIDPDSVKLRY